MANIPAGIMQQWSRAASRSQSRSKSHKPIDRQTQAASSIQQKLLRDTTNKHTSSDSDQQSNQPQNNHSHSLSPSKPSTTINTHLHNSILSHIELSFQEQEAQWKKEKIRLQSELAQLKEQNEKALLIQQKANRLAIEIQIFKERVNVLERSNAKEIQRRRELEDILDQLRLEMNRIGWAVKKRDQSLEEERNALNALILKQSSRVQALELELEKERMGRIEDKEAFAKRQTEWMHEIQERFGKRAMEAQPSISIELPERMHKILEDWKQRMEEVMVQKTLSYDVIKPKPKMDTKAESLSFEKDVKQSVSNDKKIVDKCTGTEPERSISDAKEEIVNVALLDAYFLENANGYHEELTLLSDRSDAESSVCEESKFKDGVSCHESNKTFMRWDNRLHESVQHVIDNEDALLCRDIQDFYDAIPGNTVSIDA